MTLALSQLDTINLVYLLAAIAFIYGLKMLGKVKTAVRGNFISAVGMLIAAAATFMLVNQKANPGESFGVSLIWIGVAMLIGTAAGLWLAIKTPITGMPQMVGLLNGFGGLASMFVGIGDYARIKTGTYELLNGDYTISAGLTVLVGGITFTGSLVAFGKLQGLKITPQAPVQFKGQIAATIGLLLACLALTALLIAQPTWGWTLAINAIFALALGILLVIGIGGADMPVVISLMNSYSGIAAALSGFVLRNELLIITGALVGASGIILTNIMCKAMNRSLLNVLFGGVGSAVAASGAKGPAGQAKAVTAEARPPGPSQFLQKEDHA